MHVQSNGGLTSTNSRVRKTPFASCSVLVILYRSLNLADGSQYLSVDSMTRPGASDPNGDCPSGLFGLVGIMDPTND